MTKRRFDWAKLTRHIIINAVIGCKKQIVNQALPVNEIHSIFSKHIKSYFPIKVKKNVTTDTELGCIYIGGMYYSGNDAESKTCIELILQYSLFDNIITITSKEFKRIVTSIADTLLHEALHMKQYRSRKFKVLPEYASTAENRKQRLNQNYLGCTDEIDSYGFNIACELIDKFKGNDIKIAEYLNKPKHRQVTRPGCWLRYLKAFDNDHNHSIIKRIKKRVIYYLPYAKVGSPFKPSDKLKQ